MLDQDRFVVNLNSQILDKKNRDEPFLWFPWVLCAFLSPHTDFTDLTDIISLDANVFRALRGFCVPFFPHTDFTDLTDFISLDVNVFRDLRGFCVPLSDPLNIRVHLWHFCETFLQIPHRAHRTHGKKEDQRYSVISVVSVCHFSLL